MGSDSDSCKSVKNRPMLAIAGDLAGSKSLANKEDKTLLCKCLLELNKNLGLLNGKLKNEVVMDYSIYGGDSFGATLSNLQGVKCCEDLFPMAFDYSKHGLNGVHKAIGIGKVNYIPKNNDSNSAYGYNYVNGNIALSHAKQAYKLCGYTSIRFKTGDDTSFAVDSMLNEIGVLSSKHPDVCKELNKYTIAFLNILLCKNQNAESAINDMHNELESLKSKSLGDNGIIHAELAIMWLGLYKKLHTS